MTNTVAELRALRDGLQLANQLNISKLIVELDAKVQVELFSSEADLMHSTALIVCDCRTIMQTFQATTSVVVRTSTTTRSGS